MFLYFVRVRYLIMNLYEFIEKTTATKNDKQWVVNIPLFDGTNGKLFVEDVKTEFEAKEKSFIFLNNYFKNKKENKQTIGFVDWLMENCELADDNSLWTYNGEDYTNEKLYLIYLSQT